MDRTAGWVLGSVALVAAVVLHVAAIDEGNSTAYLIGAFLGAATLAILIGCLLRLGYVKLVRRDQVVWSPWVLVIAAVVPLVAVAGRVGEEVNRAGADRSGSDRAAATATPDERCGEPARTAKELTESLSAPWKAVATDEKAILEFLGAAPPGTERRTARAIARGRKPVAAVVVVEMNEDGGSEEELFAGFSDNARAEVEDASLGSRRAKLQRSADGGATLVGLSDPCAAAMVFGDSPDIVRELAGVLPVED